MKWKMPIWMMLLSVSVLMLPSCNLMEESRSAGEQVLNLPIKSEPPNLDSAKTTDTVSGKILNNVMEGLMCQQENGKMVLGMAAEEPKLSADQKTYTIKLRDAKWSDGKPVTAYDFEYGWLRALDPKTASEYSFILYPLLGAKNYNTGKGKREDVGVKALDAKTLEVKLERPTPYFKSLLSFTTYFPQRKDIIEKPGPLFSLEADRMVYNGPFVLTEWKHEKSLQLRKNDQYWDKDAVKLDEVNFVIVKDTNTSLNLFKAGEIDYTELDSEFAEQYKNDPEKKDIYLAGSRFLEMNLENKLFQNQKVRQAIKEAIDLKSLTRDIIQGATRPAGALVPPSIQGNEGKRYRDMAPESLSYNPTKAKKLFQEGLKELGIKQVGSLEMVGDDNSLSVKCLTFIKEQLRVNLNLDVQMVTVPFKQRLVKGNKGDFDLIFSSWIADYDDPLTFMELFMTDSPNFNHGDWSNKEYDALVKQASIIADNAQRMKNFAKAEKILIDDAGMIPLFYIANVILKKPYVKGIIWHPLGTELSLKWAYVER